MFLEERPGKAGLGTAYKYGFDWALKRNYDNIVQMDDDLSHDPKEIEYMVSLLNDYDLVIGSRYIDGVSVVHWPIKRLLLSYGANVYARIVTGLPLNDSTGGFKAWKRKVLESIDHDVKNTVFSYIPNTAEVSYFGLMQACNEYLNRIKSILNSFYKIVSDTSTHPH